MTVVMLLMDVNVSLTTVGEKCLYTKPKFHKDYNDNSDKLLNKEESSTSVCEMLERYRNWNTNVRD